MTRISTVNKRDREQMTTDLRIMWIRRAVDGVELDQRGIAGFTAAVGASHKFDAWLADIRAAAWEEGREAGRSDTHDHPAPNPYREEEDQ